MYPKGESILHYLPWKKILNTLAKNNYVSCTRLTMTYQHQHNMFWENTGRLKEVDEISYITLSNESTDRKAGTCISSLPHPPPPTFLPSFSPLRLYDATRKLTEDFPIIIGHGLFSSVGHFVTSIEDDHLAIAGSLENAGKDGEHQTYFEDDDVNTQRRLRWERSVKGCIGRVRRITKYLRMW